MFHTLIFRYSLIILIVIYISKSFSQISVELVLSKNSLCYSWIPHNKYIMKNGLCNINCSYVRKKKYPLNKPFRCKSTNYTNFRILLYKVFVFNTTTYGKLVNKYREFDGYKKVFTFEYYVDHR